MNHNFIFDVFLSKFHSPDTPPLLQRLASTDVTSGTGSNQPSDVPIGVEPTTSSHSSRPKRRMRKLRISSDEDTAISDVFVSPELLPSIGRRFRLKDYLVRLDCYRRRMVIDIPEFYVGKLPEVH